MYLMYTPSLTHCVPCQVKKIQRYRRCLGSRVIGVNRGKFSRRIACYTSEDLTMSGANLVGLGRLELPTSPLSGVRSNQLSYRPEKRLDQQTT
jgi:hypothetical protein